MAKRKPKTVTRSVRLPKNLADAIDKWIAENHPAGAHPSANAATIMLLWHGIESYEADEAAKFEEGGNR